MSLFHPRNPIWTILLVLIVIGVVVKFWPVLVVAGILWFVITRGPRFLERRRARNERAEIERRRADLATRAAFEHDLQMQINRTGPFNPDYRR